MNLKLWIAHRPLRTARFSACSRILAMCTLVALGITSSISNAQESESPTGFPRIRLSDMNKQRTKDNDRDKLNDKPQATERSATEPRAKMQRDQAKGRPTDQPAGRKTSTTLLSNLQGTGGDDRSESSMGFARELSPLDKSGSSRRSVRQTGTEASDETKQNKATQFLAPVVRPGLAPRKKSTMPAPVSPPEEDLPPAADSVSNEKLPPVLTPDQVRRSKSGTTLPPARTMPSTSRAAKILEGDTTSRRQKPAETAGAPEEKEVAPSRSKESAELAKTERGLAEVPSETDPDSPTSDTPAEESTETGEDMPEADDAPPRKIDLEGLSGEGESPEDSPQDDPDSKEESEAPEAMNANETDHELAEAEAGTAESDESMTENSEAEQAADEPSASEMPEAEMPEAEMSEAETNEAETNEAKQPRESEADSPATSETESTAEEPAASEEEDTAPALPTKSVPRNLEADAFIKPKTLDNEASGLSTNGLDDIETDHLDQGLQPARYKNITPGKTSLDELRTTMGEPTRQETMRESVRILYETDVFPWVEVIATNETVERITIRLREFASAEELLQELQLSDYTTVDARDDRGAPTARIVPERGVRLQYAAADKGLNKSGTMVEQLTLEPVNAAAFLLRAQWSHPRDYSRKLADLTTAQELRKDEPRVHFLRAQILRDIGRIDEALMEARQALRMDPENPEFELMTLRLLGENGQYARAIKTARDLTARESWPDAYRAAVTCEYGSLIANGQQPDPNAAMPHHQRAIQLATTAIRSKETAVRRLAKQTLFEAHLEIACEIAAGTYQGKEIAVEKWLANGRRLALDMVANEQCSELCLMTYYRKSLIARRKLRDRSETEQIADDVMQLGRKLLADPCDRLFAYHVEWETARALYEVVATEIEQEHAGQAERVAAEGLAMLSTSLTQPDVPPRVKEAAGRMYYATGIVLATTKSDHRDAIRWYEKALACLPDADEILLGEMGEHGDRLVKIGLSYWSVDQHTEGMRLTKKGTQLIQRAVKNGMVPERALAVPYSNLSAMHKQLGNDEESKSFASMAARLESGSSMKR